MKDKELRIRFEKILSRILKALEDSMTMKSRITVLEGKVEKLEKKLKKGK